MNIDFIKSLKITVVNLDGAALIPSACGDLIYNLPNLKQVISVGDHMQMSSSPTGAWLGDHPWYLVAPLVRANSSPFSILAFIRYGVYATLRHFGKSRLLPSG